MAITRPRMTSEEKRWRAQDDLHTLKRAKEIQGDRGRVAEVKKLANEHVKIAKSASTRRGK